ncbi:MAG TPA: glycosyltransferase family 4 protein [Pyrinomonadaceae bacterium]|nr:glycosyltransferase family 4 protein [Pyrinomonadaceae bacterium]
MRILQICSAREIGGGERHLADLANALADRGHEIFAAISPGSPLRPELSSLASENIVELPMRNALNVSSGLRLSRLVRERRIEIIHAHMARDYPLAALAAGRSGARLVLTRHVLFPLSKIHRLTLRRTSRVIAVSTAVADGLRAQNIFSAGKIVTIHNGIDVERFGQGRGGTGVPPVNHAQDARATRQMRVGMVGHLAPIKGQEEFIRAAAIVCRARDDVDFIIAGEDKSRDGENRASIEKLIRDLDLKGRIQLTGWIDDVAGLLAGLDVFVSPARAEPFGLSIVEAMAAGVPVIATASEGAREIIDPDESGRLVPIGNVEALAKSIADVLDDANERERLARNATAVAHSRFTLQRMVDRTEQLYREVIAEPE